VLDPNCRRLVPHAFCSVIVEILVAGAHAADVEGKVLLDRQPSLIEIVTYRDRHEWADIVSRQALLTAALGEAGVKVRPEQLEALRVHKSREHAIRYLGGIADARWCDRGRIYLHLWIAVHDALQRLAKSGRTRTGEWDLVVLACVGQRLIALEYLADIQCTRGCAGVACRKPHRASPPPPVGRTARYQGQNGRLRARRASSQSSPSWLACVPASALSQYPPLFFSSPPHTPPAERTPRDPQT